MDGGWTHNDANMALDILDWTRLWGDSPVSFEQWKHRLHKNTKLKSAKRNWLRLRKRLLTGRYKHFVEVSTHPLTTRGELELAILPGAAQLADALLDQADDEREARLAARAERKRAMQRERSRRRRRERQAALTA